MRDTGSRAHTAPLHCVVTVGTFDGLHVGHMALFAAVRSAAARDGLPGIVVTFDPHPLRVVRPDQAPALLTPFAEKLELLAQAGPERVIVLAFDRRLADLSPDRFVREILVDRLGTRRLVVGYDHGFGRDRSGDTETLRTLGAQAGFAVDVVPPVALDGNPVSSSRIRRALLAGDVHAANAALGRAYALRGRVVRGDGRGRALGYPTANLDLPDADKLLPLEGIYAVRVDLDGEPRDGVLHLGPRPTYPDAAPAIEVHLFDFDRDLYGRSIAVHFVARIRGIEKYTGPAPLAAAIAADCARARALLASPAALAGGLDTD